MDNNEIKSTNFVSNTRETISHYKYVCIKLPKENNGDIMTIDTLFGGWMNEKKMMPLLDK
jgi:hypothetical protein